MLVYTDLSGGGNQGRGLPPRTPPEPRPWWKRLLTILGITNLREAVTLIAQLLVLLKQLVPLWSLLLFIALSVWTAACIWLQMHGITIVI